MTDEHNGKDRRKFYFNKEVSLGHILQMIVIVGALIMVARDLDSRIIILEQSRVYTDRALAEIKETLKSIDRKMGRTALGQ